jgi:integrase
MPHPTVETLQEDQVRALNANAHDLSAPLELALRIMLDAGLRLHECVQTRWEHIIWQGQPLSVLRVPRTIAKNAQERTVPMTAALMHAVRRAWDDHPAKLFLTPINHAIYNKNGTGPTSERTIQRMIQRLGETIGVVRLHPHILRHTFATRLLAVSNTRIVQQALGHARIATTEIYTHPNSTDMANAIARVP